MTDDSVEATMVRTTRGVLFINGLYRDCPAHPGADLVATETFESSFRRLSIVLSNVRCSECGRPVNARYGAREAGPVVLEWAPGGEPFEITLPNHGYGEQQ